MTDLQKTSFEMGSYILDDGTICNCGPGVGVLPVGRTERGRTVVYRTLGEWIEPTERFYVRRITKNGRPAWSYALPRRRAVKEFLAWQQEGFEVELLSGSVRYRSVGGSH